MKNHSPNVELAQVSALAIVDPRHERSARVVREALTVCPASVVARRLDCHEDNVRRWGRGQGSPTMSQVMASPERFALALLAAAGRVYEPPVEVVEISVGEMIEMLTRALAAVVSSLPKGVNDLSKLTDEQLDQADEKLAALEDEARRKRAAIRRVQDARKNNKGGR